MASEKIDQVKGWLGEVTRYMGRTFHVVEDTGWVAGTEDFEWRFSVDFYTEMHKYRITAVDRENARAYLGCIASLRFPRPGECWRRGSDLPDGDLNRETWVAIKNCIIAYELVDPAPTETPANTTFVVLAQALQGALAVTRMTKQEGHWVLPDFAMAGLDIIGGQQMVAKGAVPEEISEKVIECLCSVMHGVPVEMLPELLVSEDSRVATAAARRSRHRRYGGAIKSLRLLVTKILNS